MLAMLKYFYLKFKGMYSLINGGIIMNILDFKMMVKSMPVIKTIARYCYILIILWDRFKFNIYAFCRKKFNKSKKYAKLKRIKNKYLGERCFIISTGPSITIEDLEKLGGEITFSMNSIVLAFDETEWRPTFYGIQDEYVCQKLENSIKKANLNCTFIGSLSSHYFDLGENTIEYPLDLLNHKMPFGKHKTKFSDNCYFRVYDGYSITYSLIQIAIYMGFKEIYLLGSDCSYLGDKKHFREHGIIDSKGIDEVAERLFISFEEAKRYADTHDVKIYNATRGGALEIFRRVNLDDVLYCKA